MSEQQEVLQGPYPPRPASEYKLGDKDNCGACGQLLVRTITGHGHAWVLANADADTRSEFFYPHSSLDCVRYLRQDLRSTYATSSQRIANLEARNHDLEEALAAGHEKLGHAKDRVTALEGAASEVYAKLSKCGDRVADLESEVASLQGVNRVLNKRNTELEGEVLRLRSAESKPLSQADWQSQFAAEPVSVDWRDMTPVPMILTCPLCNARHIDEGDFATKVHRDHACQSCGLPWRPALVPTVGVQFLPGYKNEVRTVSVTGVVSVVSTKAKP